MTEPAVLVEGVSRRFGITLSASMHLGSRDTLARLVGRSDTKRHDTLREGEFWALHNVSFALERGRSLGIMGVNGSGKTTLLRLLNGTYRPDNGRITLRGRVGSLIAAGAGFSPMLTGRENVYVNGALLGLSHDTITRHLDDIIAFSELDEFINMPVRHYSSGMFVRLGFAIAAMARPDILLIDEVLAVGDIKFQKKCFDYLHRLKAQGTSIILVSHSPGAVWALCDSGLLLHKGTASPVLPVETIIRAYDHANQGGGSQMIGGATGADATTAATLLARLEGGGDRQPALPCQPVRFGDPAIAIAGVRLLSTKGEAISELAFAEPFVVAFEITCPRSLGAVVLRLLFDARHYRGICEADGGSSTKPLIMECAGRYTLRVHCRHNEFRPGCYGLTLRLTGEAGQDLIAGVEDALRFRVRHPQDRFLYAEDNAVMHLSAAFSYRQLPQPQRDAAVVTREGHGGCFAQ